MPQVISLGEALIDMFAGPVGVPLKAADSFTPAPGGAPANVAVALARLGVDVGFVGLVGQDPFGELLTELLQAEGVDASYFRQTSEAPTMVALVAASSPNEQDFIIYPGAASHLKPDDIDRAYLASAKIFIYGSVTLTKESHGAALQAVQWANQDSVLVAFDANLRPALWPDLTTARQGILRGMQGVDICKVNEVELELLAGTGDLSSGSRWILDQGVQLCLVTLGAQGTYYNNGHADGLVPAFKVDVVDTTGCGDAFLAGMIAGILETPAVPASLDAPTLERLVRFANAAAALSATRTGAMAALPARAAVENFLMESDLI